MRRRLWTNLLILIVATLFFSGLPTSEGALTPADTTNANAVMPSNTLEACNAYNSNDLDSYGKAKIATGPFSWCFLRAIAAVAPARSWTEEQIKNGVSIDDALDQTFNSNADVPKIMKYMTWGIMSISTGVVWLLVLIFFIAPALWCLCYRKCCFRDADLRGRTGRLCNTITFWICWVLAFIFVFGSIYWSSWMRPDFHAALCLPMKTGEDLYLNGIVQDGSTFASLSQATDIVQQFEDTAYSLAGSMTNNEISLETPSQEAMIKLWEPATAFSEYLWSDSTTTDYLEFTTGNLSLDRTQFGVQLYDNRVIDTGTSSSSKSKNLDSSLFDSSNTDYIYRWQSGSVPTLTVPPDVSDFIQNTVVGAVGDIRTTVGNLQDQFIDIYNQMIDYLGRILEEKEPYDVWPFALLITFSCLPVIGLVAAILLFLYYKRDAEFATQSNSRWRWWAGFMIFGYSFWGIILFIYGGAMLGAMYFPSDICRAIDKTLDSNDVTRYDKLLGTQSIDATLVNSCIKRDPDTSLWSAIISEEQWNEVDSAINTAQGTVVTLVEPWLTAAVATITSNIRPRAYVIPAIPLTTALPAQSSVEWFCTGLDQTWEDAQLEGDVLNTLQNEKPYDACFYTTPNGPMDRFDTITNLTARLDDISLSPGNCLFCIYPYCSDERSEMAVNIYVFQRFPIQADYLSQNGWTSKGDILSKFFDDWSTGSPTSTEAAPLKERLNDCGRNDGDADFAEWWWRFYVLVQRAAVLYDGWIAKGDTHELGWTSRQPIFTQLINRENPFDGSKHVQYSEWKASYVDDFNAIVNAHTSDTMKDQFSAAIVSESSLGEVRSQYDYVVSSYDCRAVSLTIEEIKDSVCDSLFGDVAAVSTLAVWLAVLHLIAFIVLMIWWVARRRYRDKQKVKEVSEAEESSDNKPAAGASPVVRQGLTEAEFFYACEHGDTETARKAAEQYPANSVVDLNYNNTPLHLAAYYGHVDITQDLCERGWDPNAFNFKRHTPFTACVSNLYLDTDVKMKVMTILKNYGAWIDVYTGEGDTPLMIATRGNERQIVALLLEWDANPLKRDGEYHWSTLKLAQSANNYEVLEMLREASPRHQSPQHEKPPIGY